LPFAPFHLCRSFKQSNRWRHTSQIR